MHVKGFNYDKYAHWNTNVSLSIALSNKTKKKHKRPIPCTKITWILSHHENHIIPPITASFTNGCEVHVTLRQFKFSSLLYFSPPIIQLAQTTQNDSEFINFDTPRWARKCVCLLLLFFFLRHQTYYTNSFLCIYSCPIENIGNYTTKKRIYINIW